MAATSRAVVLDGEDIIGILLPSGGQTRDGSVDGDATRENLEDPVVDDSALEVPWRGVEPARPAAYDTLFEAYPSVAAPDAVTAGEPFNVTVGFSRGGTVGAVPFALTVQPERADLPFVVSVMGHGLDFPEGPAVRGGVHAATVTRGVPVVESPRRLRSRYAAAWDQSATSLSYVSTGTGPRLPTRGSPGLLMSPVHGHPQPLLCEAQLLRGDDVAGELDL